MDFKIQGKYPVLRCFLNKGEEIITSSENMSWMTDKIDYSINSGGGFQRSLARSFNGEGLFQNTYKALADRQEVSFTPSSPGEIIHIQMDGYASLIAQKNTFLAAESSVVFNTIFTKKFSNGLLTSRQNFILQEFSGKGNLFLESDGSLVDHILKYGESIIVDQGNLFLFDSGVTFELTKIKGMKNSLFGNEDLFLIKLTGPGKVVLQTLPSLNLSEEIIKTSPSR